MRYKGLSLEDEKYLDMINKLNAQDLISLNKSKEVELGLADSDMDYKLILECERKIAMIDAVLQARALKN
tara:strand:+ start:225 stop:434 length:210 start_codon:yes stop_codon:yes gene_type:complete